MSTDAIATCSRCGAPTAIRFGDLPVCEDCYTALASCCAGGFEAAEHGVEGPANTVSGTSLARTTC